MPRKVNEDMVIQDQAIAQKILNTDKEINKRLNDIAQKNKEIATLKQQRQALEDQALKAQKATVVPTEKTSAQQPVTTPVEGQPITTEGIVMPSLSDFLNEEEESEDDDEEKPRYVPYFHDERTGYSWMEGKPRYRKFSREARTEKNDELNYEYDKANLDIRLDIADLRNEYKQIEQQIEQIRMEQDELAGQVGFGVMDALGSGVDPDELVAKTGDPNAAAIARDYQAMMDQWNDLEDQLDNIREQIKTKNAELDDLLKNTLNKIEYEDAWEKINLGESEVIKYDEDYDVLDGEDDDGEKSEDIFFIRIPPENEDEEEIIAKIFRGEFNEEEEDGKWYVRDVNDTVDWITDLVFEENYSKPAIMAYLADILGDVEEISEEEYNDAIDDKEENDKEYYES